MPQTRNSYTLKQAIKQNDQVIHIKYDDLGNNA